MSQYQVVASRGFLIVVLAMASSVVAGEPIMQLELQTRNPQTSEVIVKTEKVDPAKVAVVIVDPWNYHWCMTWTQQAGGMTERRNRALEGARKLGMTVFWGPTDVASQYVGTPQRERALAVPYIEVPHVRDITCKFTVPYGPCLCGPGISCAVNYGEELMDPRLVIAEDDLIVCGTQELYSLCKQKGITHLIYMGGATNICLSGKPVGLGPMYRAGLDCVFARDLAFAWTTYDPARGYTPTMGNRQAADDLERGRIATINMGAELKKLGLWDDTWVTEPIRITPAGQVHRPYFFEKSVTVTLEAPYLENPYLKNATIHYTLDGSQPTAGSPRYEKPLVLTQTSELNTVAFRDGRKVSLPGSESGSPSLDGRFVRLGPRPPKPDVYLDEIEPIQELYARLSAAVAACFWRPAENLSYEGKPLRIRGQKYEKGVGMRAPANIRYELKGEYDRFVALAGVDDNMLDVHLGRFVAGHPSVVLKVFIDGELAAESPVMRISQEPWRFDVKIPEGARQINLVATDADSRSPCDLANWAEAGFVLNSAKR